MRDGVWRFSKMPTVRYFVKSFATFKTLAIAKAAHQVGSNSTPPDLQFSTVKYVNFTFRFATAFKK